MNSKKRIVVVGATSAIAEQCTRMWLEREPADLTLVGRDAQRIERIAKDLKVRSPHSDIRSMQADFLSTESIHATVNDIAELGHVDIVLIAHGTLPEQRECQDRLESCRAALEINGISSVLFAEAFAKDMERVNRGTLVMIGSVAGDRGRKSNYVYGAAKGLVTRYAQGLQHRFAGTGVKVVLIKPGPTDTPMTAHLKEQGVQLASVENVAKQIIESVRLGKEIVYAPKRWLIIMFVISHLPKFIFHKMNI